MTAKRQVEYPTADEVARAIVEAAANEGEDPIAVAKGRARSRARVYAFIALAHRFPTVNYTPLMRMCGARPESAFSSSVAAAQIARGDESKSGAWFSLDTLNKVVEACGWPTMTAVDAELRRQAQKPRGAIEGGDSDGAEIVASSAVAPAARIKAWIAGECDASEFEESPPLKPLSTAEVEQEVPVGALDIPAALAAPEDSAAARTPTPVARPERKALVARPSSEPRRAAFANAGAIELHYRPDRPATTREVEILTAGLCGDPAPGRSALAQRQLERGE